MCAPDSQLTLEAVYAVLGVVSVFHASVLEEPALPSPQDRRPIPWVFWLGAMQQALPVDCAALASQC